MKRPFLWGIAAFIGGILSAWYGIPLIYIALTAFGAWLIIYLLMFCIKRYINRKDFFLWGLPLLMLVGFFAMKDRMKPPDIDAVFEEKSECSLTGEIDMIVKKSLGTTYYLKNNRITLPDNHTYLVEEVIVNEYTYDYPLSKQYRVGNIISVSGTVKKFSVNSNPGTFNEYLYYKSQNISYKVTAENISIINSKYSVFRSILDNIKEELVRVYSKVLPKKEAGILMAMVLGEKYLLEDEIKLLYQENGISHILAISGLHVSMVGAAIYYLLKRLRLGLAVSTLMSLAFVYSYGILTNFSVSTNRAVVMYSIFIIAKLIGRTFDILTAMSLSAFLILLQNPMELFQAGFLLSFGAVLGIAVILPCFSCLHESKNLLVRGICASISAQVLTLPVILYYFFQIPLYSVFINLLVLPLTSMLMLSAIISGIAGIISSSLGVFLAGGANYILKIYEMICRLGSSLPKNLITVGRPDTIRIIIYYAAISVFIISAKRLKKKGTLVFFIAAVVILIAPKLKNSLTVTVLDVGQGEAIFMENDNGTTYLVDGGSSDVSQVGRYRITPYLLSKGVDTLDYVFVTHTDMDHVSGIMEIIAGKHISVRHLILPDISPDISLRNETYNKLEELAKDKGIMLMYVAAGDMITDGKLKINVLHPCVGYQSASNNDYSTVLSVSYGEFDMLLTGDIETKGDQKLITFFIKQEYINRCNNDSTTFIQTDYDVLKVAHHGSKNSTSEEILSIIRPEYALISCSKKNKYGHPHEEVLERLKECKSQIMITPKHGAIMLKTDGNKLWVDYYLKDGGG